MFWSFFGIDGEGDLGETGRCLISFTGDFDGDCCFDVDEDEELRIFSRFLRRGEGTGRHSPSPSGKGLEKI